jgi:glycerol-3-phosphate dehydrogenase subunit C
MAKNSIENKKVAFFSGCFTNYYYPEAGEAAVAVLRKNGVEVIVPDQVCCALPMVAKGNIKGAFENMNYNTRELSRLVERGYVIVSPCSSCSLMLKRDYPALLKNEKADLISENFYHITEYLLLLHKNRLFNTVDLLPINQTVFYHTPCHLRAQEIGSPSVDILKLIPGIKVIHIGNVCCGMSGAYGYEKKNYTLSKEIAAKLYADLKEHPADQFVTDCGGCKLQIEGGITKKAIHPLVLLREAYNI